MARDVSTLTIELNAEDNASRVLAAFGGELVKIGESTDSLSVALRKLGTDLESSVTKKVEANNLVLAAAAKQFQAGQITAADFARASTAVSVANEKLQARLRGTAKAAEDSAGSFGRLGAFLRDRFVVTLGDVTRGFAAIGRAFGSVISASTESEDSFKALDNSLVRFGASAGAVAASLNEQAAALQLTTRFSDESIRSGQALLASFGATEEGIKRGTQAAVDLATVLGKDLGSAFETIAKAANGQESALGKLGIKIDESIPQAERFAAILSLIGERFGGRAAADSDTFSGSLEILKNQFGELEEVVGDSVTQNTAFRDVIQDVTEIISDPSFVSGVEAFSAGLGRLAKETLPLAIDGFSIFIGVVEGVAEKIMQVADLFGLVAPKVVLAADGAERASVALDRLGKSVGGVNTGLAEASPAFDAAAASIGLVADKTASFAEASAILGLGIKEATGPVIDLDKVLADLKARFDAGKITLGEYLNAYEALRFEMVEGIAAGERQNTTVERSSAAQKEAATQTRDAAAANREYAEAIRSEVIPAIESAGRAAALAVPVIHGVFDRSGNAIAGVTGFSQGGTRAELAGGGSRLVSRTGGSFGSQRRSVTGTSTYLYDPQSGRMEKVG